MRKYICLEDLDETDACNEEYDYFNNLFGEESIEITLDNCKKFLKGSDLKRRMSIFMWAGHMLSEDDFDALHKYLKIKKHAHRLAGFNDRITFTLYGRKWEDVRPPFFASKLARLPEKRYVKALKQMLENMEEN